MAAPAVGGGAAELRGEAPVLVRRPNAGVGRALREGHLRRSRRRAGEEGQEEAHFSVLQLCKCSGLVQVKKM